MTAQTTANGQVTYAYDPKGRRTTKSGAATTYYLNDGDDEIAEYTGGSVSVRYVPGATIDHPIAMVPASGSNEYFQVDHHGTIIATSGSNGKPAEGPFVYDSYGNCGATCSGGEPYKFVGRRLDPETNLYYYRARYYSPQVGRFLQTDPVGYTADMDLYTYVGNDPVNLTDSTGSCPWCLFGFVFGGGVDMAMQRYVEHRDLAHTNWARVGISATAGAASGGVGTVATLATTMTARMVIVGAGSAAIGATQTAATEGVEGKPITASSVASGAAWSGSLGLLGQSGVEVAGALGSPTMSVGDENLAEGISDTTSRLLKKLPGCRAEMVYPTGTD